jgi:hypothetical protein
MCNFTHGLIYFLKSFILLNQGNNTCYYKEKESHHFIRDYLTDESNY